MSHATAARAIINSHPYYTIFLTNKGLDEQERKCLFGNNKISKVSGKGEASLGFQCSKKVMGEQKNTFVKAVDQPRKRRGS